MEIILTIIDNYLQITQGNTLMTVPKNNIIGCSIYTGDRLKIELYGKDNNMYFPLKNIKDLEKGKETQLLNELQTWLLPTTETTNDYTLQLNNIQNQLETIQSFLTYLSHERMIDNKNNDTTYYGYANPLIAEEDSYWAIKRTKVTVDGIITQWANGAIDFVNSWADRKTLIYL